MTAQARNTGVELRAAREADCEFVWRVNNDPRTRVRSVNTDAIDLERHRGWFAARIADPDTRLSIVTSAGEPAGVVRIERVGEDAFVSIALAPPFVGRGLGRAALELVAREAFERRFARRIVARIRTDNEASVRAFEAAGFSAAGRETVEGVELLRYELASAAP